MDPGEGEDSDESETDNEKALMSEDFADIDEVHLSQHIVWYKCL